MTENTVAGATKTPATETTPGSATDITQPCHHHSADRSQNAQLTADQLSFLLAGIRKERVGRDGKGFSHVEAWDIRRHLIRVFGFGGYDTDQQDMTCVAQIEHKPSSPNGRSRWTVIYRATVMLTVKINGVELGHWHGTATGDAPNLPSLADAHDMAMKTADSQALKRAAVNLGDAFGLSLYNDGSLDPVVNRSLAHEEPPGAEPMPEDSEVRPEPGSRPSSDEAPTPERTPEPQPQHSRPESLYSGPQPGRTATTAIQKHAGEDIDEWQAALTAMWDAAKQADFKEQLPAQFAQSFGHPIEQGSISEFLEARDRMMNPSSA